MVKLSLCYVYIQAFSLQILEIWYVRTSVRRSVETSRGEIELTSFVCGEKAIDIPWKSFFINWDLVTSYAGQHTNQ